MFDRQVEEKVAPEYLVHIARLSKLHVPDEKRDQLCQDLGKILAAVRQIQQVNTEGRFSWLHASLTLLFRRCTSLVTARGYAAEAPRRRGGARYQRRAGAVQRKGARGGLFCSAQD